VQYELPLIEGRLIKRYKRFLADIRLADGSEITVHCPNTGSMKRCAEPDSRVWLSDSANPKRKYQFTWEWVEVDEKYKACVNTARPNRLVEEALLARSIPQFTGDYQVVREPKVEDGRLDFRLDFAPAEGQTPTYIEVKSVTLLEQDNGLGCFPDAVTARGLKHLQRLLVLHQEGHRAVLLFCVPHEGIQRVRAADHIDPAYAKALSEVVKQGVEVLAYSVKFDHAGMTLLNEIPVDI
jgi:sugar fermentation stimulation protein A